MFLLQYWKENFQNRLFKLDQLQQQPGSFFIAAQTYFIHLDFDYIIYLFQNLSMALRKRPAAGTTQAHMGNGKHMTTQHLNWSRALMTASEIWKHTYKYNNVRGTYCNVGVLVNWKRRYCRWHHSRGWLTI